MLIFYLEPVLLWVLFPCLFLYLNLGPQSWRQCQACLSWKAICMRIEAGQKHSLLAGFASKEEHPSLVVPLRPSAWYHRREGTHVHGDPMLQQGMAQTDCSQRPSYAAHTAVRSAPVPLRLEQRMMSRLGLPCWSNPSFPEKILSCSNHMVTFGWPSLGFTFP